jgi:hypothetical protein
MYTCSVTKNNIILLCFDVCGVDKFFGDAASVHFIFEAGTSPVAVLSGKLDQVPLYGGRNRIGLSWTG